MEFSQLPPRDTLLYMSCYCEENIYKFVFQHVSVESLAYYTVMFLSNSTGTIPLFSQRLQTTPVFPVIWDYHVVLVYHPNQTLEELLQRSEDMANRSIHVGDPESAGIANGSVATVAKSYVYDLDTRLLEFPCPAPVYFSRTFSPPPLLDFMNPLDRPSMTRALEQDRFRRYFRLVPAAAYLAYFWSERSHMRNDDGSWKMPPPAWGVIKGAQASKESFPEYIDFKGCESTGDRADPEAEYLGIIVDEERLWRVFGEGAVPGVEPLEQSTAEEDVAL
ncbi:hypothetical protein DRE_04756 [Drechslerella stenobrocha 248]|uniref:Protein N-terminal glutamine amidohydrolase n=1 Tax=Drechslerella stenobrocha 248 TaxID=1043628 RepID=W7I192_9PEZI|nr:hypothetical protein DRE_04756 [Drechslerella stenobrocha 248]